MATDGDRSREARTRAERALVDLGLALGGHARDVIVIGGLNPDFLAPHAPVPHQGTTDVDLLLEVAYVFDREDQDFAWLDAALTGNGFQQRGSAGWQWVRHMSGHNVQIDILCDVPDNLDQAIGLPGSTSVTAKNLVGPSGAFHSPIERELSIDSGSGVKETVRMRFASLGGYLLAKASALVTRGLAKDAYDFMFVVLFCPGGPDGAVEAIQQALGDPTPGHDRRADALAALRGYLSGDHAGQFAVGMQDSGDDSTSESLVVEAQSAARRVLRQLSA